MENYSCSRKRHGVKTSLFLLLLFRLALAKINGEGNMGLPWSRFRAMRSHKSTQNHTHKVGIQERFTSDDPPSKGNIQSR